MMLIAFAAFVKRCFGFQQALVHRASSATTPMLVSHHHHCHACATCFVASLAFAAIAPRSVFALFSPAVLAGFRKWRGAL